MYTVYILYSKTLGKYYTGQTADLEDRLRRHNSGETISVKKGIPWNVVWTEVFETRAEAMRKERSIKGRGAARFLQDIGLR